jgi:hypothetical protein
MLLDCLILKITALLPFEVPVAVFFSRYCILIQRAYCDLLWVIVSYCELLRVIASYCELFHWHHLTKNFRFYLRFRCADIKRGRTKGNKMKDRERIYVPSTKSLIYFFTGWTVRESNPGKWDFSASSNQAPKSTELPLEEVPHLSRG